MKNKVKLESDLSISNPVLLTVERFMFKAPKNYNTKNIPLGTDDVGILYYCGGKGELKLDNSHKSTLIVTSEMYTREFREKLHPYVQIGIDLSFPLLK